MQTHTGGFSVKKSKPSLEAGSIMAPVKMH